MSDLIADPGIGPKPPVAPPLKSGVGGTAQTVQPQTIPDILPPLDDPVVLPESEKVLVILQFSDGTQTTMNEGELAPDEDLPMGVALEMKFMKMMEVLSAHQERLESFEILDPELKVLYQLSMIINNSLDNDAIKKLDGYADSLPTGPARFYLKVLIAKALYKAGRISLKEMKQRLKKLSQCTWADAEFFAFYTQFLLEVGDARQAIRVYNQALKKELGIEKKFKMLLAAVSAVIDKIEDPEQLGRYGALLMLWAGTEKSAAYQRRILFEAKKCFARALADKSFQAQVHCKMKLGEISLLLAKFALELDKDEDEVAKRIDQAVRYFEKAIWLQPENPHLRLLLVDAYILRAKLNEDKDDYEKAMVECESGIKFFAGSRELSLRLISLYALLDEEEKAFSLMAKMIEVTPDEPMLYALRGDLYAHNGNFKKAFASYETAFAKALKTAEPAQAYAAIYHKFCMLRMNKRIELSFLTARYHPNPFRMLLRMIGDFMYFINPFNMLMFAIKAKPSKYTREQLAGFLRQAKRFESGMLAKYSGKFKDVRFYLANIEQFIKMRQEVSQLLRQSKKGMFPREYVVALKALKAGYISDILNNIKIMETRVLAKKRWQAALDRKDGETLASLLAGSLQNYLYIVGFLSTNKMSKYLKKKLIKTANAIWKKMKVRLDQLIELAEDEEDLETAFLVFQLCSRTAGLLEKVSKKKKVKALELTKQVERLSKFMRQAIKATIDIAEEEKDWASLLEIAKDYKHLGEFSLQAFKAAIEVAEDEEDIIALEEISLFAFRMAKEEEGLSRNQRTIYHSRAVKVCKAILKLSSDKEEFDVRFEAAVQLWRLGSYQEAISAFEEMVMASKDAARRSQLLVDIAYMHLALGERKRAIKIFRRVLKAAPRDKELRKKVRQEMRYIKSNKAKPTDVVMQGQQSFSAEALRAVSILYAHWLEAAGAQGVQAGIKDLYEAAGRKVMVWTETMPSGNLKLRLEELTIGRIRLKHHLPARGKETDAEIIRRELAYAGLKEGDVYDAAEVEAAARAASLRLKTFRVIDTKTEVDEETGEVVVEIEIKEEEPFWIKVGGGGGNMHAKVFLEGGINNLLGGGEKLGIGFDYNWFYGAGSESFSMIGGKLFYKDPHLFLIGEDHPVSFAVAAERYGRRDYESGGKEVLNGGSVALGIQLSRYVGLHITPNTRYIESSARPNFWRQGLRISLDYDDRNDWMLPSDGQIASIYVEPGVYHGGMPNLGFVKGGVSAEKYFALPADFVLMFGARAEAGYNLIGGDFFSLSSGVRGSKYVSKFGAGLTAGTMEVRSPILNLGEFGEYGKVQPYIFTDAGGIFNFSGRVGFGWGVGGGVRLAFPFVGMINLYFGFPSGFGFQLGYPIPMY